MHHDGDENDSKDAKVDEEDDILKLLGPCTFSYLRPNRDAPKWTTEITNAGDIASANKMDLVTFLVVNVTVDDWKQLDLSSMSKKVLLRHAIAIAIQPGELTLLLQDCLTPYAHCSYDDLMHIAMKRNMLPPKTPTLLQLQRSAMFGNQTPLKIDAEGEAIRRLVTEQCLDAVSGTFLEARVEEEANRMLDWAMRDALAHTDSTILMDRLLWLDKLVIGRKTAEKVIRYLRRHILPFLKNRKDILLTHHACSEALKIDRKLHRPCIAISPSTCTHRQGFFQSVPLPELSSLREPQRLAFLALKERSDVDGATKAAETEPPRGKGEYDVLMRLRSWLSRMLRASYTDSPLPWKDGEAILEALRSFQAKISPCPLMVVLPTGVGKSGLMCLAPFALARKPLRVLVICPTIEIRNQMRKSFLTFYKDRLRLDRDPRVLLIAAAFDVNSFADYDVYVATYHLLIGNAMLASYPRSFFDLVLVDEAHHAEASTYRLMREHFVTVPFFYFTGTPYRSDHQALRSITVYSCTMKEALLRADPYIKHVCYSPVPVSRVVLKSNVRELEIDGFDEVAANAGEIWPALRWADLSKIHVIEHAMAKLRELRSKSGIHHQAILQASDSQEAHRLVNLWRCHPDNVKKGHTPSFAANDDESTEDVKDDTSVDDGSALPKHTSETKYLSIDIVESGFDKEHNDEVLRRLKADELDAIVHIGMIGEGFDCPHLSVCCIFRRFGSMGPFMQLVGRVMRRIDDENATEDDNVAYIVCHPGLGLHLHWQLYNQEDEIPDAAMLSLNSPSSAWIDILEEFAGGEQHAKEHELWFSSEK